MWLDKGTLLASRNAAQFIVEDTEGVSYAAFLDNRLIRQAVERNFIIVGEAINRLRCHDPAVAARISAIPEIIGMRNVLIHVYDEIDYSRVWSTIETSVPILLREAASLLEEGEREDEASPSE
jgi:uncharacterized protein with HEPN domain